MPAEKVFYYLHEDGKLIEAVLTHVDGLIVAGNAVFNEMIRKKIAMVLTVSKIERDKFRFTVWDIEKCADGRIRVSMNYHAKSMEEVKSIIKGERTKKLNCAEMMEYRRFTGKLNWLDLGTHTDLNYTMLEMSKKNNSAILANIQKVTKVMKKVKSKESEVFYRRVGDRDELQLIGIEYAFFKQDEKVVRVVILLLANNNFKRAGPIYWKIKQIERVGLALKNAETLIFNKMVDDAVLAARKIETLLYRSYEKRLPIHLYTD